MTRTIHNKMALWKGTSSQLSRRMLGRAASQGPCKRCARPQTQFVQHYNWRPVLIKGSVAGIVSATSGLSNFTRAAAVPDLVDPDRWLQVNDGLHLVRLVRRDGTVPRGSAELRRGPEPGLVHHVALHLSAAKRALLVVDGHQVIKTVPLKGLWGKALRFEEFVHLDAV